MATKKVKCPACPVMLGPETTEKEHAEDCKFVIGVREGIKAIKEGRTTPWSEVKRELGIEVEEARHD